MTPQSLVAEVRRLFSLPDVALRLNELVSDPDSSNQQIVEVLQLDTGLAATVLRMANSAWYGLSSQVDSLARAVALIGHSALRDLVLAVAFIQRFRDIPGELVNMKTFWDNSVACGVAARNLARQCRLRDSEQMFLAGLLHKVGRLVFFAARAQDYRLVLARAEDQSEAALVAAERQQFGFCHADLGGELLQLWQLPPRLCSVVAHQYSSGQISDYPRERAILQVAGDMANYLSPDIRLEAAELHYAPQFDDVVWTDLGLQAEDLTQVLDVSLLQTYELIEIINPV